MREEAVHSLVLGAGPSGLAAAYTLAKAGCKPVLIERSKFAGGLMRSIRRGDFTVDVGRKELYNRLEKVDAFWGALLGADYRPYPHRGGVLYEGCIIDALPNYQGFRRGMPWPLFFGVCADFLWWRLKPGQDNPKNLQEMFYQQRGKKLTQIFSQGFQEKLYGRKWTDVPPEHTTGGNGNGAGFFSTVKGAIERTFSKTEPNTFEGKWRHPAKGTGQICELLEQGLTANGGRIDYGSQILEIKTGNTGFEMLKVQTPNDVIVFRPQHVVTSIPIEFLLSLLGTEDGKNGQPKSVEVKNTVILVYLFLNEPPRFPQTYLHVTCPTTRIGRITNYAAFNGDMVPRGKTALCCELYSFGDDKMLQLSDKEIADQVLKDCANSKLVDPQKAFDHLVLRFPGADASQNKDNWMNQERLKKLKALEPYKNVYYTNRTELDIATLAGIEAGEAILSGSRSDFDRRSDPNELEIRTETKAFAFA
jgi:protoporphyrinogen oxidase